MVTLYQAKKAPFLLQRCSKALLKFSQERFKGSPFQEAGIVLTAQKLTLKAIELREEFYDKQTNY